MADPSTTEIPASGPIDEQLDALHSMGMTALRERYREVFHEEARTHNLPYLRKKIAWRLQELAEGGLSELARGRIRELSKTSPIRHRGHPQPRAPRDVSPEAPLTPPATAAPPPAPSQVQPAPPVRPALPAEPLVVPRRNRLVAIPDIPPGEPEHPPAPPVPVLAPAPRSLPAPASVVPPTAAAAPRDPEACEVLVPSARSQRDPRLPPAGSRIRRSWGTSEHLVIVLDKGFLYDGERFPSLSRIARKITGSNWNGFVFFGLTSPWKGAAS